MLLLVLPRPPSPLTCFPYRTSGHAHSNRAVAAKRAFPICGSCRRDRGPYCHRPPGVTGRCAAQPRVAYFLTVSGFIVQRLLSCGRGLGYRVRTARYRRYLRALDVTCVLLQRQMRAVATAGELAAAIGSPRGDSHMYLGILTCIPALHLTRTRGGKCAHACIRARL